MYLRLTYQSNLIVAVANQKVIPTPLHNSQDQTFKVVSCQCGFPMCSKRCCLGSRHQPECNIFSQAGKKANQMEERYKKSVARFLLFCFMLTGSCNIYMTTFSRYALVMPIRVMAQVNLGDPEGKKPKFRWERRACWTRWPAWWTTWRTDRRRRPTSSSLRRRLLGRSSTSVSRSLLSRLPNQRS